MRLRLVRSDVEPRISGSRFVVGRAQLRVHAGLADGPRHTAIDGKRVVSSGLVSSISGCTKAHEGHQQRQFSCPLHESAGHN